jgi:hypothetical protein
MGQERPVVGSARVFDFLDGLKLSRKLALISAIYAMGIVFSVAYTVVALRAQENAGIVIGTAGTLGRWNEQLRRRAAHSARGPTLIDRGARGLACVRPM